MSRVQITILRCDLCKAEIDIVKPRMETVKPWGYEDDRVNAPYHFCEKCMTQVLKILDLIEIRYQVLTDAVTAGRVNFLYIPDQLLRIHCFTEQQAAAE